MIRSHSYRPKFRRATGRAALLLCLGMCLGGCTTFEPGKLWNNFHPRWKVNEVPYEDEEVGLLEKSGRNVRDGLLGIVDNIFQGAFSIGLIAPFTGLVAQKVGTMAGDVIGLIDDNAYTEHVFKGILSRQFLKFGSTAQGFLPTLGKVHQVVLEGPEHSIADYIGNETFHTKVYGRPSAVTSLLGTMTADLIVRPMGNFVLIFGFRDQAQAVDKFGLDLIQKSTEPNFL